MSKFFSWLFICTDFRQWNACSWEYWRMFCKFDDIKCVLRECHEKPLFVILCHVFCSNCWANQVFDFNTLILNWFRFVCFILVAWKALYSVHWMKLLVCTYSSRFWTIKIAFEWSHSVSTNFTAFEHLQNRIGVGCSAFIYFVSTFKLLIIHSVIKHKAFEMLNQIESKFLLKCLLTSTSDMSNRGQRDSFRSQFPIYYTRRCKMWIYLRLQK